VVAICTRTVAEQQDIPVSHVDIPGAALGAAAARLLLHMLDEGSPPSVRLHPPTLVEHGTCANA
jgi:DNA-binding LacI/PurR family transcriptional regulator